MATTMISPAGSLPALDGYIGSIAAKDIDAPDGPTERAEFVSTIGDCTSANFTERVRENARQQGQTKLAHEAYHLIISQAHDEADPHDEQAGHRQHAMARALVAKRFPGHMAKLVTQRDNGRWVEGPDGERTWTPGKWHTHCIIANASSREAVLEMADGSQRRYTAGRAIDGPMKNIYAIRHGPGGTDELILEHMGYDNRAYVDACTRASTGRGDRASAKDLAQRADPEGRGYSSHDEVRVKLREARALATDWDDYTARLAADGVHTRVTGKSGVSYAWVGDDGLEHKARARGKTGLGNDFTKAKVEAACEINAGRIAKGEELVAPERVMVPAPAVPVERPRPVYLTPDGKPPWEREVDEYAAKVQERGGTVEQIARERIDLALEDSWITDRDHLIAAAPDHGITVSGRTDEPLIGLDTTGGRIVFEAGHLGENYTGGRLDRRIKARRKERDHDHHRGPGNSAGRDAERRSTAEVRVERIDGAAAAALAAANLARTVEQRAELDDNGSQHVGHGVERTADLGQQDRGPDHRVGNAGPGAEQPGREAHREARSDTPLRDAAVRREQGRPEAGTDRERG